MIKNSGQVMINKTLLATITQVRTALMTERHDGTVLKNGDTTQADWIIKPMVNPPFRM